MKKNFVALVAGACALCGGIANAAIVSFSEEKGFRTTTPQSEILVTFTGAEAAFTNDLFLVTDDGVDANDIFLFSNRAAIGTQVNLGAFAPGTELLFRLFVTDTGNNFFAGNAARNIDLFSHARVQFETAIARVGFEDLMGGGDQDFDDLSFTIEQADAVTPIPAAGILLVTGFAGLAGLSRRKRHKA